MISLQRLSCWNSIWSQLAGTIPALAHPAATLHSPPKIWPMHESVTMWMGSLVTVADVVVVWLVDEVRLVLVNEVVFVKDAEVLEVREVVEVSDFVVEGVAVLVCV